MINEEFGISEKILKAICNVFSKYPEVEKAAIIGSRARGNYQKGSDIDIVIWAPELDFSKYLRLVAELEDLEIPYKIDLLKYELISNNSIKEHIEKVGKEIFKKR
ncbi:MAG: nucleotidyltransferase domain-containing protein [bacterium]